MYDDLKSQRSHRSDKSTKSKKSKKDKKDKKDKKSRSGRSKSKTKEQSRIYNSDDELKSGGSKSQSKKTKASRLPDQIMVKSEKTNRNREPKQVEETDNLLKTERSEKKRKSKTSGKTARGEGKSTHRSSARKSKKVEEKRRLMDNTQSEMSDDMSRTSERSRKSKSRGRSATPHTGFGASSKNQTQQRSKSRETSSKFNQFSGTEKLSKFGSHGTSQTKKENATKSFRPENSEQISQHSRSSKLSKGLSQAGGSNTSSKLTEKMALGYSYTKSQLRQRPSQISKVSLITRAKEQSIEISGIDKTVRAEEFDGKELKRKLKDDIADLESKRKKFKRKLEEYALNSDSQDRDLHVIKFKTKNEVKELNRLNLNIDKEMAGIQRLEDVQKRNHFFDKQVKGQSQFNNQLAAHHQQQTQNIQMQLGITKKQDLDNKDEEAGDDEIQICQYEVDPQAVQILNEIQTFRQSQTIDTVRSTAMILSGISAPVPQVQAIVVKLMLYRDIIFPPGKEMIVQRQRQIQKVDKKGKPVFDEKDPDLPIMVPEYDKNGVPRFRDELAYQLHGEQFDIGNGDLENLQIDPVRQMGIKNINLRKDNPNEVLDLLDETEQYKKENIKIIDDDNGNKPDALMDLNYEYIDKGCYFASFKIYQNTNFEDLKLAACDYWGFPNQCEDWVLTDEYFNLLTAYKDTVQMFYEPREEYQPLTQEQHNHRNAFASVFLMRKNNRRKNLHYLQFESAEINDQDKKEDEDNKDGSGSDDDDKQEPEPAGKGQKQTKFKPKKINIKRIANYIVGLKTYENTVTELSINKYIKFTESHNEPSLNIWIFLCQVTLLLLNLVGKSLKNDYVEEYQIRKIVESFFAMEGTHHADDDSGDPDSPALNVQQIAAYKDKVGEFFSREEINELSNIDVRQKVEGLKAVHVKNKQDLYNYFIEDFSLLFFTPEENVQQLMRIVGPIRLRSIHTKLKECTIKSPFKECYSEYMLDDDLIEKKTINGVPYQSCEQLEQNHYIQGEQAVFPCGGYVTDAQPYQMSPADFQKLINSRLDTLFGESARGLNLEVTLYSPRSNMWSHIFVLYEYGIQGEQVLSQPTSNFQTFRLNTYQTAEDTEKLEEDGIPFSTTGYSIFVFDIVKLCLYVFYFGKQQINDALFFKNHLSQVGGPQIFQMLWNGAVMYLNIMNFIYFIGLSLQYDVNDLLRNGEYVDSQQMSTTYQTAQIYDSFLVIMNMLALIQFTTLSRRVSLVFKLIGITMPYLFYIIGTYMSSLLFMGMIVWQVYGDKLSYFRNIPMSIIYTLALFDLKSLYLGKDFMAANQYGVDASWLFVITLMFAVVLHYSVTLQFSAFFHIYFNIAQKYEQRIHSTHIHLKKGDVLKQWLLGIKKNPFAAEEESEEED